MQYSEQQLSIPQAVADGGSLIVQGAAGCGKTAVLKNLDLLLQNHGIFDKNIFKTAASGIAALELTRPGGQPGRTVSSLLHLGIYDYSDEEIIERNYDRSDIRHGDIFIIDEAYSLSRDQMRHIDLALQTITKSNDRFGGCQVILLGDHCQLAPNYGDSWDNNDYTHDFEVITLNHSFRHESDPIFLEYLEILRAAIKVDGDMDLEVWWTMLLPHLAHTLQANGLIVSAYYDHAQEVNAQQQKELSRDHPEIIVHPKYYGENPVPSPYEEQRFSVGTPVVHVLNRNGLVNGSRGVVTNIDFNTKVITITCDGVEYDITQEVLWNRHTGAETVFYPIMQAYSLTARKVQGMTLPRGVITKELTAPHVNLRKAYTALSRFTHRGGIFYLAR